MVRTASTAVRQTSISRYQPPPVKGWVANEDITALDSQQAYELDNWYPSEASIDVRRGFVLHATGLPATTKTLMPYNKGAKKLFAAVGGAIYDVTAAGAVGAPVLTAKTSDEWQHVNFGTSGGNFLIAVNGSDIEQKYNGTTFSDISMSGTGYAAGDFIHVNAYQSRLFFIKKDSLSFFFLPIDSIGGTVTEFRLNRIATDGGYLVAMGTWTRDGGSGLDDFAVFLTSEGQAIIYQGTDPADASAWSLVGVFKISPPVGRNCFMKLGGELIVITRDGYYPVGMAISQPNGNNIAAISRNISAAVREAVEKYGSLSGWQPLLYPDGGYVMVNVPSGTQKFVQHIMNTKTKAWTRFTGMNGRTFAVFNNGLYFSNGTSVYLADKGYNDNGADIVADVRLAPNAYGLPSRRKLFQQWRPYLKSSGSITIDYTINVDYESNGRLVNYMYGGGGKPWGSPWGSAWSLGGRIVKDWLPLFGEGSVGSLRMRTKTSTSSLSWRGAEVLFSAGGTI